MRQHAKLRHDDTAACRTDETAKAPIGMAGRHDRPAHRLLHLDRIGIHRHIHGADEAAEQEHADRRRPDSRHKRQEQEKRRQDNGGDLDDLLRAEPGYKTAGDRHQHQRTDAEHEDQKAEHAFADAELLLELRNLRRPATGDEAVHQE